MAKYEIEAHLGDKATASVSFSGFSDFMTSSLNLAKILIFFFFYMSQLLSPRIISAAIYIYNFIYLFMAVLGLGCCTAFSLAAVSHDYSLVVLHSFSLRWKSSWWLCLLPIHEETLLGPVSFLTQEGLGRYSSFSQARGRQRIWSWAEESVSGKTQRVQFHFKPTGI